MSIIKIKIQYFGGSPNSEKMIERVRTAIKQTSTEIDYTETIVETPEEADKIITEIENAGSK